MADVNLTVDGKKITAPAGTLLIEACKTVGIEVPSFCYYPNLSLQGACRMCLVKVEKMPKLQTACTTVIGEGMIVTTDSDEIKQARKSMLEMLLGNHPLDCPVCDAGGECELQDMTFSYGAAESKFMEAKNHKEEQQWSPVVFFDRPRCILCYRCVRVCGEGMDVWALGVQNRGVSSMIAPNKEDHLECEECGMCIDICPVGALTSGAYRYKTRPWEMKHVGTTCTHCGDGCKTTLGVRRSDTGMEIVRGDNRDKSGINGDFLCIKGRYAFDFANHEDRLTQPLIRKDGKLTPATWEEAFELIGKKFAEVRDRDGGAAIGVIGSTRTTNEETYLLSKFARVVLKTNNVDHHRTADFPALSSALRASHCAASPTRPPAWRCLHAPAILLIGNDPTEQHPLLAWQIRNNVRLHRAKLYVINSQSIKLRRQATSFTQIPAGAEGKVAAFLAGDDAALDGIATDAGESGGRGARRSTNCASNCAANRILSSSSARKFAAATLLALSLSALALPARKSSASLTTPTRAAQRTWASILTCCRDITQSPAPATSIRSGRSRRRWVSICRTWSRREKRQAEGTLRRRLQSHRALEHRSLRIFEKLRRRAGHVPDRNRRAGGRSAAGCERLREVRHHHQHLRRSATGEEGRGDLGHEDRFRNDRPHRRRHGL